MCLHMLLFVHLFFSDSDVVFMRSHSCITLVLLFTFDLLLSTLDNSNAILVNELLKAVF